MTDDELRQACEKVQKELSYGYDMCCNEKEIAQIDADNLAILMRLCRQQQAVGWREAGKVSNGKYCEAKASELEKNG